MSKPKKTTLDGLKEYRQTQIPETGPIPLDVLIAYFKEREGDCTDEINELIARHNARRPNSLVTDADVKRMAAGWIEERRICRDTASWLQSVQKRQP